MKSISSLLILSAVIVVVINPGRLSGAEYVITPGDELVSVRDRIRADRASGKIGKGESVTVTFSPGTYVFREKLELCKRDSGTETAPVTFRAVQGGTVRIFGGMAIPRRAFVPIMDLSERDRLDSSIRDKVRVADVTESLVVDAKPWPDNPSGMIPGPWLYCNGKSQTLARWPNSDAPNGGWAYFTNVLVNCGFGADKKANAPAVFEFIGDRISRWRLDEGVWITGYVTVDWHCDTLRLASYDPKDGGAKFACVSFYGVGWRNSHDKRRFFAQNLLEELDAEGEWYLDRKTRRLYWYPIPGGDEDEIVLAQALTPYFKIENAEHIHIENLDFSYSHGAAGIVINNSRQCLVKGCRFNNHGNIVVSVNEGTRNRITKCEMRDLGGAVVSITGSSANNLLPANNMIDHCLIDNFAMYKRTHGVGIALTGCGNVARDNKIFHSPDCALAYEGNEHLIANNEFGHLVQMSLDAGCIYSGHHANWLGTILFGNYIHDLARTPAESELRNAIYFDDCDWGDDVIGNTFQHAGIAVFIGGGKLHGVYNNLIRDCRFAVHCDDRGYDWRANRHGSFHWDEKGKIYARRRHAENGINYDFAPWSVVYPTLREAMDNHPEYPGMNVVSGNVIYACKENFHYCNRASHFMTPNTVDNVIVTDSVNVPNRAPQPIWLSDAVCNRFESLDGKIVARFILDESAHFAWTLRAAGKPILDRSPLGITVDAFDFGRKVIPCAASDDGVVAMDSFTNLTAAVSLQNGTVWRNVAIKMPQFAKESARAWKIPLKSLITAKEVAILEVRVWNGGAAYRWRVSGAGLHWVAGENNAFIPYKGKASCYKIYECGRDDDLDNGYPESFYYKRGTGLGVSFPEAAHGWSHRGEVVSPWRIVLLNSED